MRIKSIHKTNVTDDERTEERFLEEGHKFIGDTAIDKDCCVMLSYRNGDKIIYKAFHTELPEAPETELLEPAFFKMALAAITALVDCGFKVTGF